MQRILILVVTIFFSITAFTQTANPTLTPDESKQYKTLLQDSAVLELRAKNLQLEQQLLERDKTSFQATVREFVKDVSKAHPGYNLDLNTGTLTKQQEEKPKK